MADLTLRGALEIQANSQRVGSFENGEKMMFGDEYLLQFALTQIVNNVRQRISLKEVRWRISFIMCVNAHRLQSGASLGYGKFPTRGKFKQM